MKAEAGESSASFLVLRLETWPSASTLASDFLFKPLPTELVALLVVGSEDEVRAESEGRGGVKIGKGGGGGGIEVATLSMSIAVGSLGSVGGGTEGETEGSERDDIDAAGAEEVEALEFA